MMNYSNSVQPQQQPNDIPTVASVASIFKFQKVKSKHESSPKLNESHPLSLYFYAEENLNTAIKQLEKVKSVCSRKFHRYTERVHLSQKLLLDTIFLVYVEMDDSLKCLKPHRATLPTEDQIELSQGFSENILFAAQAIVHGFHIRGIEHCSEILREPALQLCATLEALRHVFHTRVLERPEPPYTSLFSVLSDFDKAWTEFEKDICQSYFQANNPSEIKPMYFENLINLLNNTLKSNIKEQILDAELVEELDPSIIVGLPRLALLNCFLLREKPLLGLNGDEVFIWFQTQQQTFKELNSRITQLNQKQLTDLKRWLADSLPSGTPQISDPNLKFIFNSICNIMDPLQSGINAKIFLKALDQTFNSFDTNSNTVSTSSLGLNCTPPNSLI